MFLNLGELKKAVEECHNCDLVLTRNNVVCGNRKGESKIFLAGEAPGGDEDLTGQPFTGQAGKELDGFLQVLNLCREDIYIGNVVKCRPTKPSARGRYGDYANRKPLMKEIKACAFWFDEEIRLVNPRLIITLGGVPLSRILGKQVKVGEWRGKEFFSEQYGCFVFPLYHPASVIYDRNKKEIYHEDLLRLKEFLHAQGLVTVS